MKEAVGGIQFERFEDHHLYTEAMKRLELAKATHSEKDFKLSLRICEEIICSKLRKEAVRNVAEALTKSGNINWTLKVLERLDSPKKAIVFAHICRETEKVKYLAAAEREAYKIVDERVKDFISRQVLDIVAN